MKKFRLQFLFDFWAEMGAEMDITQAEIELEKACERFPFVRWRLKMY